MFSAVKLFITFNYKHVRNQNNSYLYPMKNWMSLSILIILAACNPAKQVAVKGHNKTQSSLNETLQQKQSQGIDLFAKGSTPSSWTLEIDFDKIIRFQSLDGTDYKSTPVGPVENEASLTSTYTTRAGKGNMVITLFKESCTDALSGEKFNQRVTVDVDGKKYEGCGQYLFDAELDGKWILQTIGIASVQASDFAKGLPELSFNLSGGKLSGHDGCNQVSGSLTVMGNRIKFSAIGGTKMACPGNKKDTEFISKISNQVAGYFFKDGLLVLYLIDDSTLSFKKN
ncbi:MAG: META domain-containing protein [Sphingobacteriales bacterium]|nr:MAG: META domain-containing protein [Sphingobacteriales bacterium]